MVSGSSVTSVNFGSSTISASYTDPLAGTPLDGSTPLTVTTAVQINAVFPPAIPRASLNTTDTCNLFYPTMSANWTTFINQLLQGSYGGKYIWAVNPYITWNQIETSQNVYDFTCIDLYAQNFVNAAKKIISLSAGSPTGMPAMSRIPAPRPTCWQMGWT
jgi:hypothetical protein